MKHNSDAQMHCILYLLQENVDRKETMMLSDKILGGFVIESNSMNFNVLKFDMTFKSKI